MNRVFFVSASQQIRTCDSSGIFRVRGENVWRMVEMWGDEIEGWGIIDHSLLLFEFDLEIF